LIVGLKITELSDRRLDAFDNPARVACRGGNLRVLRETQFLHAIAEQRASR
jgi:uncharacterized protein (DUF433 family)/predicted nuclease of predicted toxin-antitoxin system